jgi:hypothetical protein
VSNFETAPFHGSPLLQLRHAKGAAQTLSDDTQGYFAGKPLRYQTVLRGRFTLELPFIGRRSGRTDHSRTILYGRRLSHCQPLGHFDQWFLAKRAGKCCTDPTKVYTMEFLQHLFDYQKFSIDLGNSFHANIQDILYGQPLQIMAAHTNTNMNTTNGEDDPLPLWSFEIWNESLLKYAKKHMIVNDNN